MSHPNTTSRPAIRVALFGLSANPPTMQGGHGDIVRSIARSGHFDEVWVVPVYRHPYTTAAKSRLEDSYEHRLRMCELGLCGGGTPSCPVVISRIEEEVFSYLAKQPVAPLRIGTIDTIDYLIRKFEGSIQFHLVLGSDAYGDLRAGKWKHSERLRSAVKVWVIDRNSQGAPARADTPNVIPWVTDANKEGIPVSSTLVRSLHAQPLWPLSCADHPLLRSLLHPDVLAYIKAKGLYMYAPAELSKSRKNSLFMAFSVGIVLVGAMLSTQQ